MKKRILTLFLTVCVLLGAAAAFTGCSKPPKVEEIYDRVVELIEASYELNTVFYGAGLPVYDVDGVYADYTHMYYGFEYAGQYEIVSDFTKFMSVDEIKQAAEKVYSTAYLEDVLYPSAFDGYAIEDGAGDAEFSYARYLEDGAWIYRSVYDEDYLKGNTRVYDYSTMKIVSPSNDEACYVSIESYLLSSPDVVKEERIRLVLQEDGQWYLDSFTG